MVAIPGIDHKLIITILFYTFLSSLIAGCGRPSSETPPAHNSDAPKTQLQSPDTGSDTQSSNAQASQAQGQAEQVDTEQAKKPLDLTLENYPVDEDRAENLFAGKSKDEYEYDFFQFREKEPSVKFKGKLYLKEKEEPEQRLENLDGGEVEVRVPLK